MADAKKHRWSFFRAGGFDQVLLETGQDIASLEQLDQKLWVALSCPTRGIEFDPRTLDLIDTDHDGRIHATEILAATKWACSVLKDPGELTRRPESLPLSAINDQVPEGKVLLDSARQLLANLGKPDADCITVEDTTDTEKSFSQTRFNGDGIVPADAIDDAAVQQVISDIIACLGPELDRSGKPGVNQAKVDQFFADLQAFADWNARSESEAETILPLGPATPEAHAAFTAVKLKVDDYFARGRLAAFDQRALSALNRSESEYLALAAKDFTLTASEVAGFPLARIEPGRALPLDSGLNPAWVDAVVKFAAVTVRPLLGDRNELDEGGWKDICERMAAYEAWQGVKAGISVEKLGLERVREILAGDFKAKIDGLIASDKALEPQFSAIASVDRLVRFDRDLFKLLNNFVSFRDFYTRRDKAIFQAGTLYLDQRSCELCIRVEEMARHGIMAPLSRAYLAYCDCVRKATGEKMTIAAAFTGGDSDNLMVGRNGLFYDRNGNDWDATIVKLVENPISVRQAFWSPYKRTLRWIEEQAAKRLAAADTAATGKLTSTADEIQKAGETGKPAAPAPKKFDVGVVAALGVAVGGITTALGLLLQAFFGLGWLMPLGLVALILLISGPSMAIAWLKLRQRNLGPLLDANGWAVNARARINVRFGASLTGTARLPEGSHRDLSDVFADSHPGRNWTIAVIILAVALSASWYFGLAEKVLPGVLPKSGWVLRHEKARATTQPSVPAK